MSSRCVALLVLALALAACSKDTPTDPASTNTGSNSPQTPSTPSTPTPAPVSLDNRVLLFIVPSATNSSSFVHEYGITLESSTQYLIRYVPSLMKADLVEKNYSPSYAPSSESWYSVDDRLFIREEVRPYEQGGSHSLTERRYDNAAYVRSFDVRYPNAQTTGCAAVVGDMYFFRSQRNWDILYGDRGGDFYRRQISTGATQKLVSYGDGSNCFLNLMASGDALYDVLASPQDFPKTISLYQRDLVTGKPGLRPIISLSESTPSAFVTYSYHFAIDNGTFYLARTRKTDGGVEVYKQAFSPSVDAQPTKILDAQLGLSARVLEVDDGHLMIADLIGGKVFLWDMATDEKKTINFGVAITNVTQIYVKK